TALGVTASHTFAAGTYTVILIVTGNGGITTQSQTVSVVALNVPPIALFTFTCSGLTCSFDASGSSDSDGTISGYEWCFMLANGGSCRSDVGIFGATANYTFAAGGSYTVTLAVIDNANAVSRTSHVVTVNAPPAADSPATSTRPDRRIPAGRSRATPGPSAMARRVLVRRRAARTRRAAATR